MTIEIETSPVLPSKILVVEDEAVARRKISLAIESHPDLQLVAALETVKEALEWMRQHKADILLTDLGFPDGSGLDVIRACVAGAPETNIMVITIASDEKDVLECIEAGATGYVLKNASKLDLLQVILDLRAGGSPMSPTIARMVIGRIRNGGKTLESSPKTRSPSLSKREISILEMIAQGDTYGEAAKKHGLSVGTVQSHIKHIYAKLQVHSRSAAVYEATRRGFLQRPESAEKKPEEMKPEELKPASSEPAIS